LTRPTPVRARSHETQGRRGKSSPLFKCQGSWRAKSTVESLATRPSGAPPSGQPPEFTDLEGGGQVELGPGPAPRSCGEAGRPSDLAGGVSGALVHRLVGDDPGKDPLAAARALGHRSTHDHLVAHGPLVHGEGQGDQTVRAARRTKDQDAGMVPLPTTGLCDPGRRGPAGPLMSRPRLPAIAQRRLADRRESGLMARSRPLCSCAPRVAPASSSRSASPCISDAQDLR
jgi:hypothetical protein